MSQSGHFDDEAIKLMLINSDSSADTEPTHIEFLSSDCNITRNGKAADSEYGDELFETHTTLLFMEVTSISKLVFYSFSTS